LNKKSYIMFTMWRIHRGAVGATAPPPRLVQRKKNCWSIFAQLCHETTF